VVNSAGYQYRYLPYACVPGSGGLRLRELILASGKIAVDETVAPINVKVHRILAGNEPDLKIRE
jgi:hypothetical protein